MDVNPVIVTSLNLGYFPLLQNLRHSLGTIGLLENLTIFSYGTNCYDKLVKHGIESITIDAERQVDDPVNFSKQNWKYITYQKIKTLRVALEMFDGFLYTDPDVIFLRNPFPFLQTLPEGFDIYGQRELRPEHTICTGFIYIKRNAITQDLFSISWKDYQKETLIGDQRYVNKNRHKVKLYGLPGELFLGGVWFCRGSKYVPNPQILKNAYMAHYNFTSCIQEKYNRMKRNNHILVYPSLRERILIYLNGQVIFAERWFWNWKGRLKKRIPKAYETFKLRLRNFLKRKRALRHK